jgi:hypothetical protein
LGGHEVMPFNLGAFAASDATAEDACRSYGLFFQWGRKEPFAGPGEWNTTTQQPLYNDVGDYFEYTFAVSSAETGTQDYATANPACFIAGTEESDFDWLFAARNNNLWSATGAKSMYDPCPAGWRVASPDVWAAFTADGKASEDATDFNVTGDYNYGWTFNTDDGGTAFFAAAGRRSFSPSMASAARNYTNVVNDEQRPGVGEPEGWPVGFYWSSVAPAASTRAISDVAPAAAATALEFRHDFVDPSAVAPRASGFSVRCMKE